VRVICHVVVVAGEGIDKTSKLVEVVVEKTAGRRVVLIAKERRSRDGDSVLRAIPHEFHRRASDVGYADVLAGHQEVVDVGRVESAERDAVGLLIAAVEDPVLEPKVIFSLARAPGAVDAERPVVGDQHVIETGVVADVGGGNGTLLAEILQRHPALQGTLAEQPHLRDQANQTFVHAGLSGRTTFTACNFFNSLPFSADAIVLKSVLHDWDDAACVKLLGHCRQALLPNGQIYIVERILPERPLDAPFTVMLDLQMMAVTGGQERTEGAYRTLLQSANLRLDSVKETQSGFAVLSASVS
jgi:SAM-dependent methyltransferase